MQDWITAGCKAQIKIAKEHGLKTRLVRRQNWDDYTKIYYTEEQRDVLKKVLDLIRKSEIEVYDPRTELIVNKIDANYYRLSDSDRKIIDDEVSNMTFDDSLKGKKYIYDGAVYTVASVSPTIRSKYKITGQPEIEDLNWLDTDEVAFWYGYRKYRAYQITKGE